MKLLNQHAHYIAGHEQGVALGVYTIVRDATTTLPEVRPRDVAAYPFIHMARGSSVRQYLDAALHPLQMQTLMEVDQLATAMGMVRAGLGVSLMPALTLFHFAQPGLVTRPLHWPGLTRRIYLVRRRERSLSLAAQSLYDQVMAQPPQVDMPEPPVSRKRYKKTS